MADQEPADIEQPIEPTARTAWYRVDDFLAIGLGILFLLIAMTAGWIARPSNYAQMADELRANKQQLSRLDPSIDGGSERRKELLASIGSLEGKLAVMPLKSWLARPGEWKDDPRKAFTKNGRSIVPSLLVTLAALLVPMASLARVQGRPIGRFSLGFLGLFAIAVFSYLLAGQETIKHFNLEYALWAVLLGLLISNTLGTPDWLRPATRTEFYIKTGLVLLGAEVLFNKLLALGLPGIFVAWVVTPIVLVSTYLFGQYILKIPSKSLNLVISADMAVCGVSAAVATAASCRAKKEELSLAIGLSLVFTVIMMVVQPLSFALPAWGK